MNDLAAADIIQSVRNSAEPALSTDEIAHLDAVEEYLREADDE